MDLFTLRSIECRLIILLLIPSVIPCTILKPFSSSTKERDLLPLLYILLANLELVTAYLDAFMEEAVQHSHEVRERQCCEDPPLPVGIDTLGADRAWQPRQVLRGRLLQPIGHCTETDVEGTSTITTSNSVSLKFKFKIVDRRAN